MSLKRIPQFIVILSIGLLMMGMIGFPGSLSAYAQWQSKTGALFPPSSYNFSLAPDTDPNAIITNNPEVSCPSSVYVNEPFYLEATLRNGGTTTAANGGLSFSFRELTAVHSGMSTSGPYDTYQAKVETIVSDGTTVSYFDYGDSIDRGGSPGTAQHLLVESNYTNWTYGTEKDLRLRITPYQALAGDTLRIRFRGTLAWGGTYGWDYKDRNHSSLGTGRENDQQFYPVYYCDVFIQDAVDVNIPILMYHKIQPEIISSDYWLTDWMFDAQMKALDAYGYTTLSFDDYLDIRSGSKQAPEKPIILTIDDGYKNLFDYAYPILQNYGMVATAFLPTGKISLDCSDARRIDSSWNSNQIEAANPVDHICWDEVRVIDKNIIRIESHSVNHPHLTSLSRSEVRSEIANSKATIEAMVSGYTVNHFAYPFGDGHNIDRIHWILEEEGYTSAIAAWGGIANTASSPIYDIPRKNVSMANSVNLMASGENNFFMRLLDEYFPLPSINVIGLDTFDSLGSESPNFFPGETVTVVVNATNSGSPVNVISSLELDNDNDSLTPSVYDSHQMVPKEDVVKQPFSTTDVHSFTYHWNIPTNATYGPYYALFGVHDEHYVLGYAYEGWSLVFNIEDPGEQLQVLINEVDSGTPDSIEFYNPESTAVDMTGWQLLHNGSLAYTFPSFILQPGVYIVVHEYGNPSSNSASDLYTGGNLNWDTTGSAALINSRGTGIDFVRWGNSITNPPAGTSWTGDNPPFPQSGQTLGRDELSTDTDEGSDWSLQPPTLGICNVGLKNKVFIPFVFR